MSIIELERWERSKTDPNRLEYAGQPLAEEVFHELKHRLEGMGCLPDEYFLLGREWEDGREVPRGADIFCTVDYGESEGVYLDIYFKWYADGKPVTKTFITGKTLGESGGDMDRMFLTASAVTKAFRGDHAEHARYQLIGGVEEDTGGLVVHFSQQEQKVLVQALLEQRERQETAMTQTEQLLRRMTGSITRYMDTVGQRPLRMSDYDKAVLAIRDGELATFRELYSKVPDRAAELLLEAAGRPGAVGREMTSIVLDGRREISCSVYRDACKRAIDIADPEKVSFLLEQAAAQVQDLPLSFHGEMAGYACSDHRVIARQIIGQCSREQIAAAPTQLLERFAMDRDFRTLSALVDKGLTSHGDAARTLHLLTCEKRDQWMAEALLEKRMWVDREDYAALCACLRNDAVEAAKLLLDGGMDLEVFRAAYPNAGHEETMAALEEHWAEMQEEQEETQEIGGMSFG